MYAFLLQVVFSLSDFFFQFLYRHKRYLDLQATVRRDPKVKNLIKDAKRDLLEKLKKADLPSAPGAKKKKKYFPSVIRVSI